MLKQVFTVCLGGKKKDEFDFLTHLLKGAECCPRCTAHEMFIHSTPGYRVRFPDRHTQVHLTFSKVITVIKRNTRDLGYG